MAGGRSRRRRRGGRGRHAGRSALAFVRHRRDGRRCETGLLSWPGRGASREVPVHYGDKGLEIDDRNQAERLRRALLDGVFGPWAEMGRAPTPAEFAARLKVPRAEGDQLLDQLQACGESVGGGILRVPESELIAVAWPFANVPTGITVTVGGGKPALARAPSTHWASRRCCRRRSWSRPLLETTARPYAWSSLRTGSSTRSPRRASWS